MYKLVTWSVLVLVVAGCNSNSNNISNKRKQAISCANNWKARGYDFDPNSMTCREMYQRVQVIQRIQFWTERGYTFNTNLTTLDEIDKKVKDIDRARYWKEKGYNFDPNSMKTLEMDQKGEELDKIKYWEKLGYYYDTNSQTVFLSAYKRTKLESLSKLHGGGGGRQVLGSSYQHAASRPRVPIASVGRGSSYTSTGISQWQVFETTTIAGRLGQLRNGSILKTTSGNLYEVADFVILWETEVRPDVTILTDGRFYKLFIRGVDGPLLCKKLNGNSHWVNKIIDSGNFIRLEDDSLWQVNPIDRIICRFWLYTEEIVVVESQNPTYPYSLINTDDGEKVEAKLISD